MNPILSGLPPKFLIAKKPLFHPQCNPSSLSTIIATTNTIIDHCSPSFDGGEGASLHFRSRFQQLPPNLVTSDLQNVRPGTYVVQVPKDQIYRTPPPQNALIAEQRSKAPTIKNSSGRVKCVLISIIIFLLVLGIIFGVILGVIKKDDPIFRVERIRVTSKGKTRQQKHQIDITLESTNPNAQTIIIFDNNGKSSLSFKDKKFANGKFPSSKQDPKNSKDINLTLMSSSNSKLPLEIRKSMNATDVKSQKKVEILLEFRVRVKMKFGKLEMKSKTLSTLCHFKVNNLAKNSRVLSQNCDYSTRE